MASYSYNCVSCGEVTLHLPMGTAKPVMTCPECSLEVRRLYSSPHIGISRSDPTMKLIDDTARTADEPDVVDALPDSGLMRRQAYTHDPRHQKLPRA